MDIFETDVELARRHVAQTERLLKRQREIVEPLARLGRDIEVAEKTLDVFEASFEVVLHHLALEEALAHSSRWDRAVARSSMSLLPARVGQDFSNG